MIPVNEPLLGERDLEYVTECVRTGWISSAGRFIEQFEAEWAAYCGMEHGIAVSNGTTALQVAVRCLDLHPGDEVILPTFTIISCAGAVVRAGAVPVVVDCDPLTWNTDASRIAARASPRAAGPARPTGMVRPPPGCDGAGSRPATSGERRAQRAASAGGIPSPVSRRMISSRARSAAV